jgi:hypothetical protein
MVSRLIQFLAFASTLSVVSADKYTRTTPDRGSLVVDASGATNGSYPSISAAVDALHNKTDAQKIFIPNLVAGLREVHPDLDPDDYMRGGLAAGAPAFTSCGPTSTGDKFSAAMDIAPGDAAIADQAAVDRLREILESDALPAEPAAGPLFVAYGDQDTIILSAWTTAALQRACAQGDVIEIVRKPAGGHTNLGVTGDAVDWISDRFAGEPAPDTCPN